VAIVVAILWMLAGYAGSHESATSGDRLVQATVKASASCQGADTEDSLTFTMDGRTHQAKLDGCGHQPGEQVAVLVPPGAGDNVLVEPADAAPGNASGLSHRVAFLLMIVATAVGGGCGYQFFRTRDQATKATPPGIGMAGRKLGGGTKIGGRKLGGGKLIGSTRTVGRRSFGKRSEERGPLVDPVAARSGRFGPLDDPERSDTSMPSLPRPPAGRRREASDDPEATGVDWFEDSATDLPRLDLGERADKT
jgi:hypothetical protein